MKKKLFATLTAVLVLWGAMFATDYLLVRRF